MAIGAEIGSSVLLYFLVFGMSATVDVQKLRKQMRNRDALLTGISLQFIILPFLGFLVVKVLNLSAPMGITLLVVTSSPGGSYSNWWCSIFNAELALSVTMTTISTLLSMIMLPVNLILYATTSYSSDVVKNLDWTALFVSLIVVIGGIVSGLICSATVKSPRFNLLMNKLGNIAGIALITFSIAVSSSSHKGELWAQPILFYIAVATPCLLGLLIATGMVSYFQLAKPERVAVAVECCYQNTGIATSVAAAIFEGDDLAVAIGVPLFYGMCEAFFLAIYCVVCWKLGWTKAPASDNFCTVISTSYEVKEMMEQEPESIEVVLGAPGAPSDLIFAETKEGYQIDEVSLGSLSIPDSRSVESLDDTTHDDALSPDNNLDTNTVEVEILEESEVDLATGQRVRGQYETVDLGSPTVPKKASMSPPRGTDLPPLRGRTKSHGAGNPVKNAISSIRAARSGKKYTKASVSATDDDEDDDDVSSRHSID